jgi:hypothetical protein
MPGEPQGVDRRAGLAVWAATGPEAPACREILPKRLKLRKCHEFETDLSDIAVRQTGKPRQREVDMSRAVRPYISGLYRASAQPVTVGIGRVRG